MGSKSHITPPKWAKSFLRFYCNPDLLEEIEGDLYEIFERRADTRPISAKWLFVWDVFRFFKWSNIRKTQRFNSNIINMTRNNFKIAARVLWKQKTNTILNIGSIAIGLACFILISLYVKQEVTFDKFHAHGDRVYRVWAKEDYGQGQQFFYTESALPLAPALEANIPEVETTVQYDVNRFLVGEDENRINERVILASPAFFKVFNFPIVKGREDNPLEDRNAIVLSERYAIKYFGNSEPVGKTLTLQVNEERRVYTVSAIAKNPPLNTGFQFDMMVSNENKELYYSPNALRAWFNISPETYVLLKEGTSMAQVEAKLPQMVKTVLGDRVQDGEYQLGLQPLTDIHLNPDFPAGIVPVGNPKYVYVLGTIGLLVLIIACINYTTLSTGQSIRRAKEVGVRKVVGAQKAGLIWQYLSESLLISAFATLVGVFAAYLLLPTFNSLAGTNLSLPFDGANLLLYLTIAFTVGIATGIYPAFVLSKLKLIAVLRGSSQGGRSANWLRKSLVVFQLLLTIFLISGTLIMRQQLSFLQNKDLGYQKEAMVSVNLYPDANANGLIGRVNSGFENAKLLKAKLEQHPKVSNVGAATHIFGAAGWTRLGFSDVQGQFKQFYLLMTDAHYLSAFGIKITEGRDFDPDLDIDKRESIIVNRAAVNYFGLEDPLGKKLPGEEFGNHRIIGITENFNFQSLHTEVEPLIITQNGQVIMQGINDIMISDNPVPKLTFKYTGENLLGVQTLLDEAWSETFKNEELTFGFVDERLRLQYENEARVNQIAGIATTISILIASFGLLGLTILVLNTKVKEIGIRKVLGASPQTIMGILMKQFSFQLIVAFVISIPITWYIMRQWLSDFAYRIEIGILVFLVSGLLAFLLMVSVIAYHAIRAARINPVNALRTE